MSIRVVQRVIDHSRAVASHKLMLVVLANYADDDGHAYPSASTLAAHCNTSERHARRILHELERSGEIVVQLNAGPKGTNVYRIVVGAEPPKAASPLTPMSGVDPEPPLTPMSGVTSASPLTPRSAPPDMYVREPLTRMSAEPSLNRQEPSESRRAARGSRISADWQLPDAWRTWCVENRSNLDPDAVADRFRDYWVAQPGQRGVKADWFATWRNWCRNEKAQPGAPARRPPLDPDLVMGADT
jgi:hypothetical protein